MPASKAIVLSYENFGEADRYIQFLTKDWGIISALAKAARKSKRRYVGGLDLFCHDEIQIRGAPNKRPYLVELTVLNAFLGIRSDLDRTFTAGKIVQWVKKLAEPSTPVPAIYSLLGQTLALIERETNPERMELLALVFKLKLLSCMGLSPRIESCVRCDGNEGRMLFDIELGGLVCAACSGGRHGVSDRLFLEREEELFLQGTELFRLAAWNGLEFPVASSQRLNRLVTQFTSFHTHVKLPL